MVPHYRQGDVLLVAVPCAGDPPSGTTDLVRLESSNAQLALR